MSRSLNMAVLSGLVLAMFGGFTPGRAATLTTQPAAASQPARDMAAGYLVAAGPFKPATIDLTLRDKARDKDLPIKVRYPANSGGEVPVIIFSHGAGGAGDAFGELTEHWASHGYCVILPTHSDSIKLRRQQGEDVRNLAAELRTIVSKVRPMERVADATFILDSLDQIEAKLTALKGAGGKGRLDRDRIGMAGHSAGAMTTQIAFGVKIRTRLTGPPTSQGDDRIKAAILISGQGTTYRMFTKESWADLARPMMAITGSLDTVPITDETVESRQEPFNLARPGDKYLIYIEGATHSSYAGRATSVIMGDKPTTDIKTITDIVASGTLAFWDCYLRADAKAKAYLGSDRLVDFSGRKATFGRK